jgi:hypothetical protein
MPANEPNKHHYVPQFYLRQFASSDPNKVMVLARHGNIVERTRKSIEGIGYEENLHDFIADGMPASIETTINKVIETPFSGSSTWKKISSGQCGQLNESDRNSLYGFARHLQRRNVAWLRFLEAEHARYLSGDHSDLSQEEREMHAQIAEDLGGTHAIFRHAALDTSLPEDAAEINIMVCNAPIRLRTSTDPLMVMSEPGKPSIYGPLTAQLRTWWLPLASHWGAFIIAGNGPGFSVGAMPAGAAIAVNRRYIPQLMQSPTLRCVLADDGEIEADLELAGLTFEGRTTHGFRYRENVVTS